MRQELYIEVSKQLCCNGYDAYLVGGYPRDMLLGKISSDCDLVTNALPDHIEKLFSNKYKIITAGKNFCVTILVDKNTKEQIEIATYRSEYSFGKKHQDFEVKVAETFLEDSKRRDLTINALATCPITGNIVDYHGGINDIKNRIIRFVGDPNERLKEDYIRAFRAARFLAKIDGKFDKLSFDAIKNNIELLEFIPPERIRIEILKAMQYKYASRFWYTLFETGILEKILPSLAACWRHPHGKHHFELIHEHMMLVGDAISTKCSLTKLTGYLHDIGKPTAYSINNGVNFIGHDKIGSEILKAELFNLRFSKFEIEHISNLTKLHMQDFRDLKPKSIRKLLKRLNDNNINQTDFFRLRVADRTGNLKKNKFKISELKKHIKDFDKEIYGNNNILPLSLKDLAINGNDVMSTLNIKPGPKIKQILNDFLELVIENPELNTKDILISKIINI